MNKYNIIRSNPTLYPYVESAKKILSEGKYEQLLNWFGLQGGCACRGPQGNEPACPCKMRYTAVSSITNIAILEHKILKAKSKEV